MIVFPSDGVAGADLLGASLIPELSISSNDSKLGALPYVFPVIYKPFVRVF